MRQELRKRFDLLLAAYKKREERFNDLLRCLNADQLAAFHNWKASADIAGQAEKACRDILEETEGGRADYD